MKRLMKKIVSGLLLASLLLEVAPTQYVEAATDGSYSTSKNLYYGPTEDKEEPYPLEGLDNIQMRGTSIAFMAMSCLVDTSQVDGSLYTAYNAFTRGFEDVFKSVTMLKRAGEAVVGPMGQLQPVTLSAGVQGLDWYLIDTIDTTWMKERYFGGDSQKAILANVVGIPKAANFVGAIMDSPDMNGGQGTEFDQELYLGNTCETEYNVIKEAYEYANNIGVTYGLPIVTMEADSKNYYGYSPEVKGYMYWNEFKALDPLEDLTYDWGDFTKLHPVTILYPVVTATFQQDDLKLERSKQVWTTFKLANPFDENKLYFVPNIPNIYLRLLVVGATKKYETQSFEMAGFLFNEYRKWDSFSTPIAYDGKDFNIYDIAGIQAALNNSSTKSYVDKDKEAYLLGTVTKDTSDTFVSSAIRRLWLDSFGSNGGSVPHLFPHFLVRDYLAFMGTEYVRDTLIGSTRKASFGFNELAILCATLSATGTVSSDKLAYAKINHILDDFRTGQDLVYRYSEITGKSSWEHLATSEIVNLFRTAGWLTYGLSSGAEFAGLFCGSPVTSHVHNISNVLLAKNYCMGIANGKGYEKVNLNTTDFKGEYNNLTLSDLEILPNNSAAVWFGARLPFYGTTSSDKKGMFISLPRDTFNALQSSGEAKVGYVKGMVEQKYVIMSNYLNTAWYQFSFIGGLFNKGLSIDISKEGTEYKISILERGPYGKSIALYPDGQSYEILKKALTENLEVKTNVKGYVDFSDEECILIHSDILEKNTYIEFTIPVSEVVSDIVFRTSLDLGTFNVDYTVDSETKTEDLNSVKNFNVILSSEANELKEVEFEHKEFEYKKESDAWGIVSTIKADAPPVNIVVEETEDEFGTDSELLLYEGVGVTLYPKFTEELTSVDEDADFEVTLPDGSKKTGKGPSNLNKVLKNDCKHVAQYYDVEYPKDGNSAKQDAITWSLKIDGRTFEFGVKPIVYKWSTSLSLKIKEPAEDSASTPCNVVVNGETKITRGKADEDANAIAFGEYKIEHKIDTDTYLTGATISSNKDYMSGKVDSDNVSIGNEEERDTFSDLNDKYSYKGMLVSNEKQWDITDVATMYTKELSSGDFRKVLSFDASTSLALGESKRIPARFDKGEADPGEDVVIYIEEFKPFEFGMNYNPEVGIRVNIQDDSVTVKEVDLESTGEGEDISFNVTATVKFSKEGEYLISQFTVGTPDSMIGLTGDKTNIKNPYGLCKVPRERTAIDAVDFELIKDSEEYTDSGLVGATTPIVGHGIKFGKTDKFSEWADLIASNEEATMDIILDYRVTNGKLVIDSFTHNFGDKIKVNLLADNRHFVIRGKGSDIVEAFAKEPAIEFTITVERTVANDDITFEGGAKSEFVYKYSTTGNKKYKSEFADDYFGKANVIEKFIPPVFCEPWELTTQVKRPCAVITATQPSSDDWKWDAMSGIPNTESLSATVGADLFKIGLGMRTHGIGNPITSDNALANDEDDNPGTPNTNGVIERTITFNVTVDKYWGSENTPCSLSCNGTHPISTGGTTGKGGQSVSDKLEVSAGPGESVSETKTLSCPGAPRWECPMCSFVHEEHAAHDMTMSASASNPKCSFCTNGCPGHGKDKEGNDNPCTCKCTCTPTVKGSDSASCDCTWSHSCKWSCTYNCSTGTATVSGGNGATVQCTPVDNAYKQLKNSGTVTVTQEEEVVTGSYTNDTLVDSGYTTGYGCVCSKTTPNCIHPGTTSKSYKIVETVDAIAWNTIENFYVNVLEGATIDVADDVFVTGTAGRTILNSGAEFDIWRGTDSGQVRASCTDSDLNVGGLGNSLIGTGRIYFTEFINPTFSVPLGSTSISADHAQDLGVVVELKIIADSKIGDLSDVQKVDAYPDTSNMRGSELSHYKPVTSSSEEYKTKPGDTLNSTQIANLTAQAANAWLNANKAKVYRVNIISDAMTVQYGADYQNVIGFLASFGDPINLFNAPFGEGQNTVYRNHACGYDNLGTLGYAAMSKGKITDLVANSGLFRNGFTGSYAPTSGLTTDPQTDGDAGMYSSVGDQKDTNPKGSLIDYLSSTRINEWNGHGSVYFNRRSNSTLETYTKALPDFYGKHSGSATVSGPIEITTREEYYGPAVDTVSQDAVLTMSVDGEVLKEITGTALLPMKTDILRITDKTKMSFLGLHLKEDAGNQIVYDGLQISCKYTNMMSFITDDATRAVIEKGAKDSVDLCYATSEDDETRRINSFIIHNPIAASTRLVGNNYGDTSLYPWDESNEDLRMGYSSMDNKDKPTYLVIGNSFILWVSNFVTEGDVTSTLNKGLSTKDWGKGPSSTPGTGVSDPAGAGFGQHLNTSRWTDHNTVTFTFPVSYTDVNNKLQRVDANTEIDLRTVAVYSKDGVSSVPNEDFSEAVDGYNGTPYMFTVELSAEEANDATFLVKSFSECMSSGLSYSNIDNATKRDSYVADTVATCGGTIEIVGRIGDVMLTDTQDYRFSNLFWKPTHEWLIPNVIKKASSFSALNVRPKFNILMNTDVPVVGTLIADLISGTGVTPDSVNMPLSGSQNTVAELRANNLGIGYSAYVGVSTIGEYTGQNETRTYPKSFLEQETVPDYRTNYLEVIPLYVLFDKDTKKFYDLEMYAGSGTDYVKFYDSNKIVSNYANALYVTLSDDVEQNRYCISDFAKAYSMCFNDSSTSCFTDRTYVGTSGKIILDASTNMVVGTKEQGETPKSYDISTGTFEFENYTANFDTETEGKQSYADYALNSRRWFFNLGLPSSTVLTYPGTANSATAILESNKKLLAEHPNSVVVCFARLIAVGSVYSLEYDFVKANGGSTIDIDGISVDYTDMPVYINDTVSYELARTHTPLFVGEVKRTSTQDLGMEGTH